MKAILAVLFLCSIANAQMVISCPDPLPTVYNGVPFAINCPITGGTPPYAVSVVAGSLPPGVSLMAIAIQDNSEKVTWIMQIYGTPNVSGLPPNAPIDLQALIARNRKKKGRTKPL